MVVETPPSGHAVYFQGQRVSSGQAITVKKRLGTPSFELGGGVHTQTMPMEYNPDPWLLGDAAFLLLGIIPGVIALGVDIGTGAWRNLSDRQVVITPPAEEPKVTRVSNPEPESAVSPFAQPIQP